MIDSSNIKDKAVFLLKYAMNYGVILGLFWVFKYFFKIGAGFSDHVFIYVYYVLNVGTFLLLYIFTIKFKESDATKDKSLLSCILFVTFVCFFASFFEGAITYAHYKFIDPAYFAKLIGPTLDILKNMPYPAEEKAIALKIFSKEPIYVIIEFIINTILGFITGLFMGFLVNSNIDNR